MRIDPEVWAKLASCVERCEAVRATYQTFDGRVSEYKLHPYHLLAYHPDHPPTSLKVEAGEQQAKFALVPPAPEKAP